MSHSQTCSAIGDGRFIGGDVETQNSGALHRVSTWDNWGCRNSVHHHTGDIHGER